MSLFEFNVFTKMQFSVFYNNLRVGRSLRDFYVLAIISENKCRGGHTNWIIN